MSQFNSETKCLLIPNFQSVKTGTNTEMEMKIFYSQFVCGSEFTKPKSNTENSNAETKIKPFLSSIPPT